MEKVKNTPPFVQYAVVGFGSIPRRLLAVLAKPYLPHREKNDQEKGTGGGHYGGDRRRGMGEPVPVLSLSQFYPLFLLHLSHKSRELFHL
jgi:hypothetical protein